MIIFLYGPDTYRSRQKLAEIIKNYKKIHKSGLNLKYFNTEEISFENLEDDIKQISMFKEKKLLVLVNAFSNSEFKEKFLKKKDVFSKSENIIIFYEEGEVSKKDSLFAFLKKNSKSQEFNLLDNTRLKYWVRNEFKKRNVNIEEDALEKLILFVHNNLWQMVNEIDKLINFTNGKPVRMRDVELLVTPMIETDIFKTINAIATRDKEKALGLINRHLEKGDSPFYLFSMINYQFRNLLIIKDLYERRLSPFTLTKLHPFVIKKSSILARKFNTFELKNIYQKIFRIDLNIKTGKIEPETALDLLIAEI